MKKIIENLKADIEWVKSPEGNEYALIIITQNDAEQIVKALEQQPQPSKERKCIWKYDEEYDYYSTECDYEYCLVDGTLKENDHNYCPRCGGKINLKEQKGTK